MPEGAARLGIDSLSTFNLPPIEFVNLVADLGLDKMSTTLAPWPYNPHGYAPFSLRDDAALRREMVAALKDRGVSIAIGEVFMFHRATDWDQVAGDLDVFVELGAPRVVALSLDPDLAWSFDQLARVTGLAAERGIETLVELVPGLSIGSIETAVAAAKHVDHPQFGLLIDMMHVGRSGGTPADLTAIDPSYVRYLQLCDVPAVSPYADYNYEAGVERLAPGEGDLPLAEMLAALPAGLPIGLEIPQGSLAEKGVGPFDRLKPCVDASLRLLGA